MTLISPKAGSGLSTRASVTRTRVKVGRPHWGATLWLVLAGLALGPRAAWSFDSYHVGALSITPTLNTRLGLQYGTGINFGLGALDTLGETERAALALVIKPRVDLDLALAPYGSLGASNLYGGVSVVVGATMLDGEIGGQQARSGDTAVNTDHAFLGWRNDVVDLSFGGQEFGMVIGKGGAEVGLEFFDGGFGSARQFDAAACSAVVTTGFAASADDLAEQFARTGMRHGRAHGEE